MIQCRRGAVIGVVHDDSSVICREACPRDGTAPESCSGACVRSVQPVSAGVDPASSSTEHVAYADFRAPRRPQRTYL